MKKLVQKVKARDGKGKKEDKVRVDEIYKTGLAHYRGRDYKNALIYFDIASENNHKDAQFILGVMYASGKGVPQNYEVATSLYLKAIENGSVKALYNMGCVYRDGLGTEKSQKKALVWFTKAAENGDPEAQYETALIYMETQVFDMAFLWFKASAENDNAEAQYSLGLLYFEGKGTQQDYGRAMTWFVRVADRDPSGRAYNNIGHMHEKGFGGPKDYKKALAFYLKASYKGNAMANNNIGKLYELGQGVQQNDAEAVTWYKISADKGNAKAQFNLGQLYLKGRPDFNPDLAIYYFELAMKGGHPDAEKFLKQANRAKNPNLFSDASFSDNDSVISSIKSNSIRSGISHQPRMRTKSPSNMLDSVLSDSESVVSSPDGKVTLSKDDYELLKKQYQLSKEKEERIEKERREQRERDIEKLSLYMTQLERQKNQQLSDSEDSMSFNSKYVPSIATKASEISDYPKTEPSLFNLLRNNEEDFEEYLAYTEDFNIVGEYIYDPHY